MKSATTQAIRHPCVAMKIRGLPAEDQHNASLLPDPDLPTHDPFFLRTPAGASTTCGHTQYTGLGNHKQHAKVL